MEYGRLIAVQLDFLIGDIFGDGWADCTRLELVVKHLLVQREVWTDIILVPGASLNSHACIIGHATFRITQRQVGSVYMAADDLIIGRGAAPFDAGGRLVVFMICVAERATPRHLLLLVPVLVVGQDLLLHSVTCCTNKEHIHRIHLLSFCRPHFLSCNQCFRTSSRMMLARHLRWLVALGAFSNHIRPIDSFWKVAPADALMIDSLFSAHVLGWVDPGLGEIHWVAHMHIDSIRWLCVKLGFYRVQRVLLVTHNA